MPEERQANVVALKSTAKSWSDADVPEYDERVALLI